MNRNKELDVFEHDDWLAKERAREKRVSFWDLDDARKLRKEHEDDCDVKETAGRHHMMHLRSENRNDRTLSQMNGKTKTGDIFWFIMLVVAMIVLIVVNTVTARMSVPFLLPVIILFLGINPGIFFWLFVRKRFPSASYSRAVLAIAILMELAYFLLPAYYRYYIFHHLFDF